MEWKEHIEELQHKKAQGKLKESILDAIEKRIPKEKFGVLFSGGIDSTFIAYVLKNLNKEFTCYCVGLENSDDVVSAEKVAKKLNLNLKRRVFSLEEAEGVIKKTVKVLDSSDVMNVGVGSTILAASELAVKDDCKVLFSGLGSEEIFAGYLRHEEASDINEECWRGLKGMYARDMIRDEKIAKALGVTFVTPFLDEDVIVEAMALDGKEKIVGDVKKVPLRELAKNMGMPDDIASRRKKAAQYGSKFDRALLRLGRKKGFKFKKEYVESLL